MIFRILNDLISKENNCTFSILEIDLVVIRISRSLEDLLVRYSRNSNKTGNSIFDDALQRQSSQKFQLLFIPIPIVIFRGDRATNWQFRPRGQISRLVPHCVIILIYRGPCRERNCDKMFFFPPPVTILSPVVGTINRASSTLSSIEEFVLSFLKSFFQSNPSSNFPSSKSIKNSNCKC